MVAEDLKNIGTIILIYTFLVLNKKKKKNSVADPGCLSWILYPNVSMADPGSGFFSYCGSWIRIK
jgi:hypothetical protein